MSLRNYGLRSCRVPPALPVTGPLRCGLRLQNCNNILNTANNQPLYRRIICRHFDTLFLRPAIISQAFEYDFSRRTIPVMAANSSGGGTHEKCATSQ